MKRSMETPGSGGPEKTFRRQNPISCQFCRMKKLKCNRASPCSNCVARSIDCTPSSGSANASFTDSAGFADRSVVGVSSQQLTSTEARLRRLEEAVFKEHRAGKGYQLETTVEADTLLSNPADSLESVTFTNSRGKFVAADAPRVYPDSVSTPDAHPSASHNIAVQTVSPGSSFPEALTVPTSPLTYQDIISGLPDHSTASIFCNHYLENVSWVYHILHAPTFIKHLRGVYNSLECSELPNPNHLAIVATIIGIGAYFKSGLALGSLTREQVKVNCNKWVLLGQYALFDAGHNESPTIETMQATILISQFLPNFATTNAHVSFIGSVITAAHKLKLHQVDSQRNKKLRQRHGCDYIELELKRRIWWHISSTDWILGFMSGPQSGTYLVNPAQMNVDYPSNCDDIEITIDGSVDHPEEFPTEMSYSRCKILMSITIREVIDEACAQGLEVEDVDYDTILVFDQKFKNLTRKLPWFFQLDDGNKQKSETVDKARLYVRWQRNMAHFGLNTRLSRLHRPYLALGLKDLTYSYSRTECLRAARMVIQIEQNMREVAGGFNPDSGRLWIIVHHMFVATVTLVMDYCIQHDGSQAAERKAEILRCYQVLEKSQEESSVARKGLAHLKQVMRDWMARAGGPVLNEKDAQTLEVGEYPSPEGKEKEKRDANMLPAFEVLGTGYPMEDFHGMDSMQDMWLDPFEFNLPENSQWEELFQNLEQGAIFR